MKSVLSSHSWIAAGLVVTSAALATPASADNSSDWGKTWIDSNRYFVMNNAYGWWSGSSPSLRPSGATLSHYAYNANNWGGSWNHNGGSGGVGVAQINYGKWPWGDWTTGSNLPVQVNSPTNVYSNWSFNKGTINGGWNAYYEVWIHNSNDIRSDNITGDLMIHPDWDNANVGPSGSDYGTYEGEVTLSGTQWYVRRQASYPGQPYDIIHYFRKNKTQSTGTLRLDDFWEHYASKSWIVTSSHWVGSVTAAFEAFNGSGSYSTTSFNVNVVSPILSNGSFESEQYGTQTPSGWSEWSGQNTTGAGYTESHGGSKGGNYHGTHYASTAYDIYTYQTKTGLANGLYTARAWVKSSGGFYASQFETKDHGNNGSKEVRNIPTTNTYTLVEIKDINVTNNQCTIGFWSSAPSGGKWTYFDEVEFFKQGG